MIIHTKLGHFRTKEAACVKRHSEVPLGRGDSTPPRPLSDPEREKLALPVAKKLQTSVL